MGHLQIKLGQTYILIYITTVHPSKFHLPICVTETFHLNFANLFINGIIIKFHVTSNIKIDSSGIPNFAIVVNSDGGRSHIICWNSKFFGLKKYLKKKQKQYRIEICI